MTHNQSTLTNECQTLAECMFKDSSAYYYYIAGNTSGQLFAELVGYKTTKEVKNQPFAKTDREHKIFYILLIGEVIATEGLKMYHDQI